MANLYDERVLGTRQKIALAQKLRESGQESLQGQMIGDRYVPASWTQQLAQGLKQGLGAYQEMKGEQELKDIQRERAQATAKAMNQMGMSAPTDVLTAAETPAQSPSLMKRAGALFSGEDQPQGTPAQPYQQTIAQNPNETQTMGGILNLAGSNPEMAAVAQAMQGRKWTREDARLKQIEDIALRKDLQTEKLDVQKQMAADRLQSQRDIQAMIQANRPERQAEMPVAIMGANGKPTYVSRSQAMGQVPYTATTAKQDAQDVAKEEQKTQATLSAQQVLDNGANLLLHPGRSMATGASGVLPTIPGTDARDFEARLNTYKAETFVPMVSALKGMGALSDAEGKKLTESVGALERTMSEKGFEDSLKETNKFLFDKAKAAGLNVQMPSGLDVHSKADEILGIK